MPQVPDLHHPEYYLRPIVTSDAEAWYDYLAQAQVIEHTSWALKSKDDLVKLIQLYNSGDVVAPIRFAFARRLDGRLMGTVGFHTISPAHRTAELAFDFHPGCWGKGLALLCAQATIKWGFDTQDFVRIQAIVLDSNQRSRRVIEKCGMHFEGRCRNYRMVRGEPRACDLFAICPN